MSERSDLNYDEVITSNGVKVPFVPEIITPAIEKPMRNNRYEGGEAKGLRALLRPGDRVLELGAGVGLLSTIAAQAEGVDHVCAVEANPGLIPLIRETHRLNGAQSVELLNGVVSREKGDAVPFYLRQDFWASSMEPDSRPYVEEVAVRSLALKDLITAHRPTVIACDIEGGEMGLFDDVDLSGVRAVVLELHPKVYGRDGSAKIIDVLEAQGLRLEPVPKPTSVRYFLRPEAKLDIAWPPADPRVLLATCMKNEGPYILEWLAWHQSIGVTDFVVYTNDCTDGTDHLLERLARLGHLRHLPNPALATGSTYFQPLALAYTLHLPEWDQADFFISMDVDEFINIRHGEGHLRDLFAAVDPFDALSISELNHGANGQVRFQPGFVTEQFPRHQTENPRWRKAKRGVKTLVRLSDKLEAPRNHRPDFHPPRSEEVVWLDGSGRPVLDLPEDSSLNGIDVRGTYTHVVLNHFPLRSLEAYLVKMDRGDVVVKDNRVSQRYWRLRNQNEAETCDFARQQKAFRAAYDALLADAELARLHAEACDFHAKRAVQLLEKDDFRKRRDWIFDNAWDGPIPDRTRAAE